MGIEEVWIGASTATAVWPSVIVRTDVGEQFLINVISLFSLTESCPEVDAPSCTPSCCLITFLDERLFTGFQQIDIRKMVTRIESYKVTLMAMLRVEVIPVIVPFVQVAHVSYCIWM